MDIFSNPKKLNLLRSVLLGVFVGIFIYHGYQLAIGELDNYLSLVMPLCFIALMAIQIRRTNKEAAKGTKS